MEEKRKLIEDLERQCSDCSRCGLCRGRHNVVFGVGNPEAEVMFIGEGPGEQEDLRGEPFVGKAGILLDKMLTAIDLDRNKNIYIANIVKCRPPQNRDPLPEEQDICRKGGVLMMPVLHPAALLRNPSDKPGAFQDFLDLQKLIQENCEHTYDGISWNE